MRKREKKGKSRAVPHGPPIQDGDTFRFMCTVQGEGGISHFMAPEERNRGAPSQVLDEQPPWIHPRKHWTSGQPSATTNWRFESDLYEKIGEPAPTEAFTHYKPTAKGPTGKDWKHACAVLIEFMGLMQNRQWLGSGQMEMMLELLRRGLENVVCVLECCLVTGKLAMNPARLSREVAEADAMPPGYQRASEGVKGWGFWKMRVDRAWEAIKDHRFIAGIFHFSGPQHWAAFVFDREAKVLVIWDSLQVGAEGRFRVACAYWREYLTTIGQPFTFQAVAVPVVWQQDGYSCGPISIWQLFMSMRGWAGARVSEFKPCQPLQLDSAPTKPVDWYKQIPIRFTDTPRRDKMQRMLFDIAINELGSDDFRVKIHHDTAGGTPTSEVIINSIGISAKSVRKRVNEFTALEDGILVPMDEAFSQFGGWHLDAVASDSHEREWEKPSASTGVKVPSCPSIMVRKSDTARPDLMATMRECWAERNYIPSAAFCDAIMIAQPRNASYSHNGESVTIPDSPKTPERCMEGPDTPNIARMAPKSVPIDDLVVEELHGWNVVLVNDRARDSYDASIVDMTTCQDGEVQICEAARSCNVHKLGSITLDETLHNPKSNTYISTSMPGYCDKVIWDSILAREKESYESALHEGRLTESKRNVKRQRTSRKSRDNGQGFVK
jgi:hypothetical protein